MTPREQQILQLIEADPMISQQELADQLNITRSSVAVHISNLLKKGYIAGKGYVLRTGSYAVVVGGVNVDIGARSRAKLVAADSNPGKVHSSLGGVGRNIAHNMTLMGVDVKMLTAKNLLVVNQEGNYRINTDVLLDQLPRCRRYQLPRGQD
mgnify:CR=1 FL=1